MAILVLNAGSSSLKYSVFTQNDHQLLVNGLIERIGEQASQHRYQGQGEINHVITTPIHDHGQALKQLFDLLPEIGIDQEQLRVIGHRVVHGGEHFHEPARIDSDVLAQIKHVTPLAPLHNPANLLGIEEAMRLMPSLPQIAVFDTAFHQTLPDYAFRYAVPDAFYRQHGVRRYGFHGTSHRYVATQAARLLQRPLETLNLITLHLGNGASVTAIERGRSIDTSMGMTPLEGLMMGTRCGDIDPAVHFYLCRTLDIGNEELETLLNKASGCKGICGENDMRAIHRLADQGDQAAKLALAMYAYRIKKYIGAYSAVLGHVDALVFTGGIGENDAWLREQACSGLSLFGIAIDPIRNTSPDRPAGRISEDGSAVEVLVIATDEELEIALQAEACLCDAAV